MGKLSLISFLLHVSINLFSSSGDTSVISQYRQFHFLYANDVYNGTDRYLTQYIQLRYSRPYTAGKSGWPVQYEYVLQQNVYTPSDIFGDTIQKNDRPYASVLFASIQKNVLVEKRKLQLRNSLSLGILGRHGFGEDMQREIHYAVDSRQARGWKYQIRDAPYIQAQSAIDKGLFTSRYLDFIGQGQVRIGTVFDDISIGQTLRLHMNDPYFSYFNKANLKSLRVSAEMKNELKFVVWNGTLQGGIGSRNNSYTLTQEQVSNLVFLTQLNLSLAYGRFGVSLSQCFISREFRAGLRHRWGHAEFSYLF